MRVSICIATCKRPVLLTELLAALSRLSFRKTSHAEVAIVVVDNDAMGTAEKVCRQATLPWPLTYVIEPKRGIASARNRALTCAKESDCVVLIDDDEMPDPTWLDELLAAQSSFAADVVCGPVFPTFTQDVPRWVSQSALFNRPVYDSGTRLGWCASNNTLIMRRVLDVVPDFDEQFQLTGADDIHYFLRVAQAGFKIVFCKEAVVSEEIGKDRTGVWNMLLRSYQGGNCHALVEALLDRSMSSRLTRFCKGAGRIMQGLAYTATSFVRGPASLIEAMKKVFLGFGMLTGLAGIRYQAYRKIKGRSAA
ncbi:MAG TPA: glycosyltransferase [Edaphobacter sp.]|nr:glycosyltransferase [Edaphobacter sp.]